MNIGETIKKLRRQKDMTQEQLAGYLDISPQAVSRWEVNSTLPDITLVPVLANIFDVTTDMILGVDIDAKEKRIGALVQEANDHFFKHQYDEAEKTLRAALKEYPNSYKIMDNLAEFLASKIGSCNKNWSEEEKKTIEEERKPIREEIVTLSEKVLAECTADNLRYWSIQRLCRIYAYMGETEKARSYAKKMPNTTERTMLTETLKGTERYNHIRELIVHSVFEDLNYISLLMGGGYVSLDDGTEPYNADECIALNHKIIDIVNTFIEKGSFGDFTLRLVNAHHSLTFLYVQKGDSAAALNHFRLAAEYAVMFDSMPPVNDDSREEYTSLLFKGIKFPFNMVTHAPFTMTEHLLERSRELDTVFPASELVKIKNELRRHKTSVFQSGG